MKTVERSPVQKHTQQGFRSPRPRSPRASIPPRIPACSSIFNSILPHNSCHPHQKKTRRNHSSQSCSPPHRRLLRFAVSLSQHAPRHSHPPANEINEIYPPPASFGHLSQSPPTDVCLTQLRFSPFLISRTVLRQQFLIPPATD